MSEQEKMLQNALQEMRRGSLVLAVLLQVDTPQYGYSLVEALNQKGLPIDQNTLYPLLRRLEKNGLLDSVWQLEDSRPRRYYQLSATGATFRAQLIAEWHQLAQTLQSMLPPV